MFVLAIVLSLHDVAMGGLVYPKWCKRLARTQRKTSSTPLTWFFEVLSSSSTAASIY